MLSAVLRTPKLTDIYQKIVKRRMTAEKILEDDNKAIMALLQYKITEENEVEFVKNLI